MCPYCVTKNELCTAALSSLMIDNKFCFSKDYHTCEVFQVNRTLHRIGEL